MWTLKKSLTKDGFTKDKPTKEAGGIASLLALWPADHVLSAIAAETAFARLTDSQQQACSGGIKPYLDDCRVINRKVCDLTTYIRERRWERLNASKQLGEFAIIKPHSIEFHRWRDYGLQVNDPSLVGQLDLMAKMGRDITLPSRRPPPKGSSSSDNHHPGMTKE